MKTEICIHFLNESIDVPSSRAGSNLQIIIKNFCIKFENNQYIGIEKISNKYHKLLLWHVWGMGLPVA